MSKRRRRQDHRREWALWVVMAADYASASIDETIAELEDAFVDPPELTDPTQVSEYYRIPRMEDHLPTMEAWVATKPAVLALAEALENNREAIDAEITQVSPRWRINRMPVVDRNLLRMGITELLYLQQKTARSTINGYVELAKSYGEDRTRKFVNGILDQVRRNHDLPFS